MSTLSYYHINEKKIAHEVIDGEAVIIHFDSGNYYSLNATGAKIWEWIVARATHPQIIAAFGQLTAENLAALETFINTLVTEGLVEPRAAESTPSTGIPASGSEPFAVPVVEKFNDMQQLLMADPIHEVEETGWPRTQSGATE